MARKYLLIIISILGLSTSTMYSQANTILYIDSANILSPVLFGDTTDIGVQVRIDGPSATDTLTGDIFYYYQTDTMDSLGIPPQSIELDSVIESLTDPFWDTIKIPINPLEMRTGPLNLIVVWPAMIHPAVLDTDSTIFNLPVEGYIGIEPIVPLFDKNIIYPSPAMQYLYIRPNKIEEISEMVILNMQGQTIETFIGERINNGWINIDHLNTGVYIALIKYKDGAQYNQKFLKE